MLQNKSIYSFQSAGKETLKVKGKKKLQKSISKEVKAKCRVCQTIMMSQGYRDHLANVHLDQDPRDLRQRGEQTLFSFRGQGTSEDSEGVRNKKKKQ